jgi:autotransporter-associated beta strand protein
MRIYSCFAFVSIISIFNGSELFSATTWIGTDGVATSAANWSNGLPTTVSGAILNGTGGTVSSTLNFGNTAFNSLDLVVSNYSGDVNLNNLTDFRLTATTASLAANGVAGSTLTINNSATSTASTVTTSANVWSGNMNVFLNRFVTHGTGARTLTTSIGQLTINDFYTQGTVAAANQTVNNSGTININTLSQKANSAVATSYMTTFAGGTVNLLGANNSTVSNGIRLNGSTTLNLAGNGSLGTADLYLNGGTSTYNLGLTSGSSSAVTLANNLIITNGTANTVLNIAPGDGKSLALNGLISSSSSTSGTTLVSFGAGTISIAGTNSYNTRSQIVGGGKLEVAKLSTTTGSALGTAGEGTAANLTLDNGTLSYVGTGDTNSRNFTIGTGGARIEANGTGLLKMGSANTIATSGSGNRSLTLAGANTATNSFSLKVADGAGGVTTLVKNGTGVWNITGTGSTYTGGTEVRGGTLIAGDGNTSGFGTGEIRLYNGTTFKASGTTTRVFTNSFRTEGEINMDWVQAQSSVNLATDTKITAMGTNSAGASSVTFNGAIGGTGGLTKSGIGSLTLSAVNGYTGATSLKQGSLLVASNASITASSGTTVDGGLLKVNGSAGSVVVNEFGSLGGSGTVGAVTLNSGSLLKPGNSPGNLTAASSVWNAGATYEWQITSLTGTAGTDWDLFTVTGGLDLSALSSSATFNLSLDSTGALAGFSDTSEYTWTFAKAAGITGLSSTDAGTDISSLFNIVASNFNGGTGPATGFKVVVGETSAGYTSLNLMTVPEPSAASLMGIGLGALMILRTIRRRQS